MANRDGDVLMLEAPPSSRPAWSTGADIIDALSYIDDEYVKEEVDRMIQREMRLSSKKPSDFLKQLPPIPSFNLEMNKKSEMPRKKQGHKDVASSNSMDLSSPDMDIRSIMKDIESFVSSKHMTWKEKKELENKKVVSLGGKPVKKQRLPLSVARVQMKKQKEREQKMLQESAILGRFGSRFNGENKRSVDKRRPEDRVLKSTAGNFRNGILDVKHMLKPAPSATRDGDGGSHGGSKVQKRKGGKKNKGKKGGGRKRH